MIMNFNNYKLEILEVSGRDPLTSFNLLKTNVGDREENTNHTLTNRTISVRAFIEADNYKILTNKRDGILLNLYTGDDRKELSFDDEDKFYLATFTKFETVKENEVFCEFRLYFDCYAHSFDKTLTSMSSHSIFNDGSCAADCTIEFELDNTVSTFTVSIEGSVSRVVLSDLNGLAGLWKVDTSQRRVYKNNTLSHDVDFTNTRWNDFLLKPGLTNFITSADVDIKVNFRKEYH